MVERALLAWDGRRAAARALSDAMALLESSVAVTVLTIGTGPAAERAEGRDVVSHLERHGVSVDWRNVANPPAGIAKCILDIADETAAGMLVMGAYEHSKFSEDLLGGVTNTVFRDAKVPILTAH
ncbi:MAG: universal stress protein [Pseudomonadota bacterium]